MDFRLHNLLNQQTKLIFPHCARLVVQAYLDGCECCSEYCVRVLARVCVLTNIILYNNVIIQVHN